MLPQEKWTWEPKSFLGSFDLGTASREKWTWENRLSPFLGPFILGIYSSRENGLGGILEGH